MISLNVYTATTGFNWCLISITGYKTGAPPGRKLAPIPCSTSCTSCAWQAARHEGALSIYTRVRAAHDARDPLSTSHTQPPGLLLAVWCGSIPALHPSSLLPLAFQPSAPPALHPTLQPLPAPPDLQPSHLKATAACLHRVIFGAKTLVKAWRRQRLLAFTGCF